MSGNLNFLAKVLQTKHQAEAGWFVARQQAFISFIGQCSKKRNIQSSTTASGPAIVPCEKNLFSDEYP